MTAAQLTLDLHDTAAQLDVQIDANAATLPDGIMLEDWARLTARALNMWTASPWWIGDMIAYGESRYGPEALTAIPWTRVDHERAAKAAWTAETIPPAERHPQLSYTHHEHAARLPAPQRRRLLNQAATENWTATRTRKETRRVLAELADQLDDTLDGVDVQTEVRIKIAAYGNPDVVRATVDVWCDKLRAELDQPTIRIT